MVEALGVEIEWTSRKVQPVVILYVVAVFVGFILIAHFVVHSSAAVKALLLAAVGVIVPLVPTVLSRWEFRLGSTQLERRPKTEHDSKDFETVFTIDELSHTVPTRHGFKYVKRFDEARSYRRFWRLHLSDHYSGQVQVSKADRDRVFGALSDLGLSSR